MSQTAYNVYSAVQNVGQFADDGDHEVLSFNAEEIIPLGMAVYRGNTDTSCKLPSRNVGTILFAGDFVTSNVINLSVNGVAISPVTFATDNATTLAAVAAAIHTALPAVSASTSGAHTIIVTPTSDPTLTITVSGIVVTLGAGQTTGSTTYSTSDIFLGVSCQEHTLTQGYQTGIVQFAVGTTVPVMTRGRIWVSPEQNVTTASAVYARDMVNGLKVRGAWRADADTTDAVLVSRARWMGASTAPALTILEVNTP